MLKHKSNPIIRKLVTNNCERWQCVVGYHFLKIYTYTKLTPLRIASKLINLSIHNSVQIFIYFF